MKRILIAAVTVVALGAFAAPAAAAGTVCYDVSVTVNGQTNAAADCVATP